MASLTKFTLSPSGDLVYKSTGKLAPSNYVFRKNTVYKVGSDGVRRRVGSLSRKLTKTQAKKIAKAEKSRNARMRSQARKVTKPSQGKPRQPSRTAAAATAAYGQEGWDEFEGEDFPEPTEAVKEEFAQRVRNAALTVAPQSLQDKIRRLSTDALWKAYQEDAYIFELYFRYHENAPNVRTSDASVWLYQFVNRIEQYMGVTE